jgi:hypothetical protein
VSQGRKFPADAYKKEIIRHLRAHTAPPTTRRYPRAVFSVPLTLHYLAAGGVRKSHGISLDIGEGGLGELVEGRLTVGEIVAIDLPLADSVLSVVAVVRYSSQLKQRV